MCIRDSSVTGVYCEFWVVGYPYCGVSFSFPCLCFDVYGAVFLGSFLINSGLFELWVGAIRRLPCRDSTRNRGAFTCRFVYLPSVVLKVVSCIYTTVVCNIHLSANGPFKHGGSHYEPSNNWLHLHGGSKCRSLTKLFPTTFTDAQYLNHLIYHVWVVACCNIRVQHCEFIWLFCREFCVLTAVFCCYCLFFAVFVWLIP